MTKNRDPQTTPRQLRGKSTGRVDAAKWNKKLAKKKGLRVFKTGGRRRGRRTERALPADGFKA